VGEEGRFIVAEVSKNWTVVQEDIVESSKGLVSQRFEQVITTNARRGYRLHSWKFASGAYQSEGGRVVLNETIVAVFEKV
jgi:hypothetical protein